MPADIYEIPLFKEEKQNILNQKLDQCETWFDEVVSRYYDKLSSVTFVIDRQEELLYFQKNIQIAWLIIALSGDYQNEFISVFKLINNYDNKDKRVKELYNEKSFIYENIDSMSNLFDNFLTPMSDEFI